MASFDAHRPDAAPIIAPEGVALVARLALGALEILAVGLLIPLAILALGSPIALSIWLLDALAQRL
jgi:hypothetical protein